jgi:hypothetical protein
VLLAIEPMAMHMLCKCSTTELSHLPLFEILEIIFLVKWDKIDKSGN